MLNFNASDRISVDEIFRTAWVTKFAGIYNMNPQKKRAMTVSNQSSICNSFPSFIGSIENSSLSQSIIPKRSETSREQNDLITQPKNYSSTDIRNTAAGN